MNARDIIIILILAAVGALVLMARKNVKSYWAGYVVNKRFNDSYDYETGTSDAYQVDFQTDDGKKVRLSVAKAVFDQLNPGDRVEKRSGDSYPTKVG